MDNPHKSADRLALWAQAFDEWLAGEKAGLVPTTRHTRLCAWNQLLERFPVPPWEIDVPMLKAHFAALRQRGVAPTAIQSYRTSILSFYRYCLTHPALQSSEPLIKAAARIHKSQTGKRTTIDLNPPSPSSRIYILRPDEVRRLLRAIDRSASLVGRRDYAFILTFLLTGLRTEELRNLRWGQILLPSDATAADSGAADSGAADSGAADSGAANSLSPWGVGSSAFFAEPVRADPPSPSSPVPPIRPNSPPLADESPPPPSSFAENSPIFLDKLPPAYLETGSPGVKPLHPAAWQAIHAYLRDSGRLPTLTPESLIFVPVRNHLLQPPTLGAASAWDETRPLAYRTLSLLIEKYAAWAGLASDRVNHDNLRHTAAALRLDQGADIPELQRYLGLKSPIAARAYTLRLARMLGARGPRRHRNPYGPRPRRGPYQRSKFGARYGTTNLITYAPYSHLSAADLRPENINAALLVPLTNEIGLLRILLRRAFGMWGSTDNLQRALRFTEMAGRTATRIAKLLLIKQKIDDSLTWPIKSSLPPDLIKEFLDRFNDGHALDPDESEYNDQQGIEESQE